MPWKNGQGVTNEIFIEPAGASLAMNDFSIRLSSAPIEQDTSFSLFADKQRLLTTIKGAGFRLNSQDYEKFEIAQFSAGERTECKLIKGPVLDFGVIYDAKKVKLQAKILNLKTDFKFSFDADKEYFITVLEGELLHEGQQLTELETLHYQQESNCHLQVVKSAVLFYLCVQRLNQ